MRVNYLFTSYDLISDRRVDSRRIRRWGAPPWDWQLESPTNKLPTSGLVIAQGTQRMARRGAPHRPPGGFRRPRNGAHGVCVLDGHLRAPWRGMAVLETGTSDLGISDCSPRAAGTYKSPATKHRPWPGPTRGGGTGVLQVQVGIQIESTELRKYLFGYHGVMIRRYPVVQDSRCSSSLTATVRTLCISQAPADSHPSLDKSSKHSCPCH